MLQSSVTRDDYSPTMRFRMGWSTEAKSPTLRVGKLVERPFDMPPVDTKNPNGAPVEHPSVALATEAFSAAFRGHMDRNARVMTEFNKGIRAATENAAEHAGQQAHNLAVAGEAFARAKSPAEFIGLQQDLFRSSSADMAAGMRKNGEMLTQAIRAISDNWGSMFSVAIRKSAPPQSA